ncbi:MAG TPA: putative lipid II flippase FtsW [Fibrobacteraceae bacterium]|nr:putative lipid II flippase FtsW [Fibrobacteraceae bacterium]
MREIFRVDPLLLLAVLLLVGLGTVVIFSGSQPLAIAQGRPANYFVVKHLMVVGGGGLLLLFALALDYSWWNRCARILFLICIVMMVSVLLTGLSAHGAKRWLSIGGAGFQPSEFMKLGLIFLLATKLAEAGPNIRDFRVGFLRPLLLVGVVAGLIMLQPNFSMATLLVMVSLIMMYSAGTQIKHLLLLGVAGLPLAVIMMMGASYRQGRLQAFLNPEAHSKAAYQQLQSLISLGNGGIFGTGLGQGTQKLGYLPMPFTDTIYAILGEEMGLIGTTLVLGLFLVVLWRGLVIAREANSRFGRHVAVALTAVLGLNAFLHIGVCTRLIPATGQPLPLVSYGGSNLWITLFSIGVLLNISNPNSGKEIKEAPGGLL